MKCYLVALTIHASTYTLIYIHKCVCVDIWIYFSFLSCCFQHNIARYYTQYGCSFEFNEFRSQFVLYIGLCEMSAYAFFLYISGKQQNKREVSESNTIHCRSTHRLTNILTFIDGTHFSMLERILHRIKSV